MMLNIIYKESVGIYVININEKSRSIEYTYIEGDYPYKVIEEFGYKQYYGSITGTDLIDFINHIEKEVISKWSEQIDVVAYLYLLDHIGIINEFTGDKLTILLEPFSVTQNEYEISDECVFKIINKRIYFLRGLLRSYRELKERYNRVYKDLGGKNDNIYRLACICLEHLESGIEILKGAECINSPSVLKLIDYISAYKIALREIEYIPINQQFQIFKQRLKTAADTCELAMLCAEEYLKILEYIKNADDPRSMQILTKSNWAEILFNNTIRILSEINIFESTENLDMRYVDYIKTVDNTLNRKNRKNISLKR